MKSTVIRLLRKTNMVFWIIVGVIVGVLFGFFAKEFSKVYMKLLFNSIFLPMVQALITPLIFSTLVVGIASHDDIKTVGRLALKSITYFMTLTIIAIFIGLIFGNIIQPGTGSNLVSSDVKFNSTFPTVQKELEKIIPKSFFKAAAENETLQIVFCSVMFAVAIMLTPSKKAKTVMLEFCESLSLIMFKVTDLVMNFVPIGVAGAIANVIAVNGTAVFGSLIKLIGAVICGLVTFAILLAVILMVLRVNLLKFIRVVKEPVMIAFASASSEAALPLAMERMIEFGKKQHCGKDNLLFLLGVPADIVGFVIPTGYSFNMDGTTLYLGAAAMFLIQAGNITMSMGEQVIMLLMLMLMAKGVAGVPRASLAILSAGVDLWNFPVNGIAAIVAVDFILDMCRTVINLLGNCVASIVVARWEKRYPEYKKEEINLDEETVVVVDEHKS
ncbi:hypothetical protein HK099_004644 [Clydaea vesicula]|uniref:Amino acid transporter n=1 Tax=Clydaea vesicula TaxID=447962 RepID=A0AAD5Y054_9FUNG|nr:hypothetical protein HK099_004644 [Clydaea vesicula]KAJ3395728.1 hypothetical protein HDU92_005043 [Lobulomyces angularis]